MTAAQVNLSVDQGSDFVQVFTVQANGSVKDLTGYTAHMQVRKTIGSPVVILDLSTTAGTIAIDGGNGIVTVTISNELTTAIKISGDSQDFVYDLKLISDENERRIVEGTFTINGAVTLDS